MWIKYYFSLFLLTINIDKGEILERVHPITWMNPCY